MPTHLPRRRDDPTRFRNVLLVNLVCTNEVRMLQRPPLGIGYLAEFLQENGIEHAAVDMMLGYSTEELIDRVRKQRPDLVAFSSMGFYPLKNAMIVSEVGKIRNADLDFRIIWGGNLASVEKGRLLETCRELDFVAVGEGEHTLLELCRGNELDAIDGLVHRKNDRVVANKPRAVEHNIDTFPFPRYRKFELDKYIPRDMGVISSRGCPYSCTFCMGYMTTGKPFRPRSASSVAAEAEHWIQRGYIALELCDDNFTFDEDRVLEICAEFKRRGIDGKAELKFGNGIRADRVNLKILSELKDIGLKFVAFGIESANDTVLKKWKKAECVREIREAVEISQELDLDVTLLFIIGGPEETYEDVRRSFDFAREFPAVWRVRFRNLVPFPGSEVYDWYRENGRFVKPAEEYMELGFGFEPVVDTECFPYEERIKATRESAELSQELYDRYLHRRLSKYGPLAGPLNYLMRREFVKRWFYSNRAVRYAGMRVRKLLRI